MEAPNLFKFEVPKPGRKTKESRRLTRGEAIKLFCLECMGYTGHRSNPMASVSKGVAYQEVKKCTDHECPLFRYRLGSEQGEDRVAKLVRSERAPFKRV